MQITSIFILSSKNLELTRDIIAPGKTLFVNCDCIKIQKYNKIISVNLRGKDGIESAIQAIDRDGKDGHQGQAGGSLYLFVQNIEGGYLKVNLNGGNGGKGQDVQVSKKISQKIQRQMSKIRSSEIKDEEQKKLESTFLVKRKRYGWDQKKGFWESLTYITKQMTTFNGQVMETYRSDNLKAWQTFYKFIPGKGGKMGLHGNLEIISSNKAIVSNKVHLKSQVSKHGQNGLIFLDLYQGKYLNELFFCSLRQQGKETNHLGKQIAVQFLSSSIAFGKGMIISVQAASQVAKITALQALEIAAKQTAKQVCQSTLLSKVLTGGAIGFGVGLGVQAVISGVSAYASSQWHKKISLKGKTRLRYHQNQKQEVVRTPSYDKEIYSQITNIF